MCKRELKSYLSSLIGGRSFSSIIPWAMKIASSSVVEFILSFTSVISGGEFISWTLYSSDCCWIIIIIIIIISLYRRKPKRSFTLKRDNHSSPLTFSSRSWLFNSAVRAVSTPCQKKKKFILIKKPWSELRRLLAALQSYVCSIIDEGNNQKKKEKRT